MRTELARIAQIAETRPKEQFTSLAHLLNEEMLVECHNRLKGNKAIGIDKVTKEQYEEHLEKNICNLVSRLRNKAYRPQPVKRVYIPKAGSNKKRPLGIPAYEDKIVQMAISNILTPIYEADFIDCSCGFRPQRGAHDAIKLLEHVLHSKKVNWVVDADITGFFDHVRHDWMMKFLEVRIKDPNILRLIRKILKAGYMETGAKYRTEEGTPQGGVVSPIVANIYLHYVLDLWFEKVVKKHLQGEAYMVRYADDFVCCFQYEKDAKRFYRSLEKRMSKFGLSISPEKSKIIEFGRFAADDAKRRGKQKPDTFDFLGFTCYCSKSRNGKFRAKFKTSQKKYRASLQRMKEWIKSNRTMPIMEVVAKLRTKMLGHYHYYGITDNFRMLNQYWYQTTQLVFKWLNRRSQRNSYTWEKFMLFIKQNPFPLPRIYVNIFERRPHIGYI